MKTITLELTEERLIKFGEALRKCLCADSLDEIEMLIEAEHIFGIKIPDVGDKEWMEE